MIRIDKKEVARAVIEYLKRERGQKYKEAILRTIAALGLNSAIIVLDDVREEIEMLPIEFEYESNNAWYVDGQLYYSLGSALRGVLSEIVESGAANE